MAKNTQKKLKKIKSAICLLGIKNYYGIKTLYKVYIESVVNSSPETDLYTNWTLENNTAKITNHLTNDAGANDYPNSKSKTVVYLALYIQWIKKYIKLKTLRF